MEKKCKGSVLPRHALQMSEISVQPALNRGAKNAAPPPQVRPFPKAIVKTLYRHVLGVEFEYEIFLYHKKSHWYMLVHCVQEGSDFPYLRLEIVTDGKGKIIPLTRELKNDGYKLTGCSTLTSDGDVSRMCEMSLDLSQLEKVGTVRISIEHLCKKAEDVRLEMGEYRMFTSNCQQFCNNVIKALGLDIKRTAFGPNTTIEAESIEADTINEVLPEEERELAHTFVRCYSQPQPQHNVQQQARNIMPPGNIQSQPQPTIDSALTASQSGSEADERDGGVKG